SGLDGPLLHPLSLRETSPETAIEALLLHVGDALADYGDEHLVRTGVTDLLEHGNGARVQRELLRSDGDLAAVVRHCARRTTGAAEGAE
ncbi:carboxylate--amine ligase, partial [Streptomyces goshikiensis]